METTPVAKGRALNNIGNLFIGSKPCAARGYFEEAQRQLPEAWEVLSNLAQSMTSCTDERKEYNKTELEIAIRHATFARQQSPLTPEVHQILGQALSTAQRHPEAHQAILEALRLRPTDPSYHIALGKSFQDLHDVDQELGHYRRAIELQPTNGNSYMVLARELTFHNRPRDTLRVLQQMKDAGVKGEPAHYYSIMGRAIYNRAMASAEDEWAVSRQQFKVAAHLFNMSMHTKSTESSSIKHQFQAMTNLAIVHLQELGGAGSVIRDIDYMMASGKVNFADMKIEAHVFKGVALRALGKFDEANRLLWESWIEASTHSYPTMFSIWAGSYSRIASCPRLEMELDNKGRLQARMQRLRRLSGDPIQEVPQSFLLPRQHRAFTEAWNGNRTKLWLLKPHAMSYGMGMRIITDQAQLPPEMNGWHVQEYLEEPLTVFGHKLDLRVYVIVARMAPLQLYVYHEGLVRMACKKYSIKPEDLNDRSMHLTALYPKPPQANKLRTVSQLFKHLQTQEKVDTTGLWDRITKAVVKVVKLVVNDLDPKYRIGIPCHKIFGVDVLVTKDLQPHILEVNRSPDMSVGGQTALPADVIAKKKLAQDLAEVATGRALSPGNGFGLAPG